MVKYSPCLLDRTFGALADGTRRRILQQLSGRNCCVTDLARPYRMSLPGVSKHIRVLEKAGLVRRQRRGRIHTLILQPKPMEQAQAWLEQYRRFWEGSFDRLEEYLADFSARQAKQPAKRKKKQ